MSDHRVTAVDKILAGELMAAAGDPDLELAARKRAYAGHLACGDQAAADRVAARIRETAPDAEVTDAAPAETPAPATVETATPGPVEKTTRARTRKAR